MRPHVSVNGEKDIGGDMSWSIYRADGMRYTKVGDEAQTPVEGEFTPGTSENGTYRFSARFLGDAHLLPSSSEAGTVFKVTNCPAHPSPPEPHRYLPLNAKSAPLWTTEAVFYGFGYNPEPLHTHCAKQHTG
ncbi:MAG: hypothetical protein ACLQBB_16065, partial [Solirubrobacteraceae bacterium]